MHRTLRTGLAIFVLAVVPVGGLVAECAPYVTSSFEDGPHSGTLTGTESVTYSISGGGLGYSGSYSVTYDVGYYKMEDGSMTRLDCRTYKEATMI
jgi:hypothetical protein